MRRVTQQKQFRRDWRRQERRGKRMEKVEAVVKVLSRDGRVGLQARPHKLSGEWGGWWECHIESDWLLIYDVADDEIILARTGTHADLFE